MTAKEMQEKQKKEQEKKSMQGIVAQHRAAISASTGLLGNQKPSGLSGLKSFTTYLMQKAGMDTGALAQIENEPQKAAIQFQQDAGALKSGLLTAQDQTLMDIYSKAKDLAQTGNALAIKWAYDKNKSSYQQPFFRGSGTLGMAESILGYNRPLGGVYTGPMLTAAQVRQNAVQSGLDTLNGYNDYKNLMDSQVGVQDKNTQKILTDYGKKAWDQNTAKLAAQAAASAPTMQALERMAAIAKTQDEKDAINAEIEKRKKQKTDTSGIGQYGAGNIDLYNRTPYKNEDGSISTVDSFSVNLDGQEVLLPTIIGGKRVTEDEAIDHYIRTGENLGKFNTPAEADAYAQRLHLQQEALYTEPETKEDRIYDLLNDDQRADIAMRQQYGADITGDDYAFALQDEAAQLRKEINRGRLDAQQLTAAERRLAEIEQGIEDFYTPEPEQYGPEYITPEMQQYTAWQEAGKDMTFADRYRQEALQTASDWEAAKGGSYHGSDQSLQQHNDKYLDLEDQLLAASLKAQTGQDPVTGDLLSSQQILEERQQVEEITAQMDAMDAQANEQITAAEEKTDAIDQVNGTGKKGIAGLPEAIWKSTKSGVANFLGGVATTFVDTWVKPWEVSGEALYTMDQNLANTIRGKSEKNMDVGEAIVDAYQNGTSQRFIDEVQANKAELAQDAQMARMAVSDSPILEVAQQLYINFIEQLPEVAATIVTGIGRDGMAKMRETMMGVINDASAKIAKNGLTAAGSGEKAIGNMVKNRGFWMTFAREFEDDVQKTEDAGANPILARLKATLEALINAGLEVGPEGTSGWQGFGQGDDLTLLESVYGNLTGREPGRLIRGAGNALASMAGEGVEEFTQGVNSNAQEAIARAITTGERTPVLSMRPGEKALINLPDQAYESMVGALGGLTMGGAMGAVNAMTQRAQNRVKAANIGSQIIDNNWGEAMAGIAEDVAGISNDTTKALRAGTADLNSNAVKRKTGQMYMEMMGKLDKASFTRVMNNMEQMIQRAMEKNNFPAETPESLRAAAHTIAKAYGMGPESLTEAEAQRMQQPEMQQVYQGMTGENESFWEKFNSRIIEKSKKAEQAMNQARAMLYTRQMTQEEVTAEVKDDLKKVVAESDLEAVAGAIVKQEAGEELTEQENAALEKYGMTSDAAEDKSITAYEFGKSGRSQKELLKHLEEAGIPVDASVRVAYTRGETARIQAERDRIQKIKELNQGGATKQRDSVVRNISPDEATHYGVNRLNAGNMSEKQKAAVKALRTVAGKMNLNIALFESHKDDQGRRVGANGFYDPQSDTVYLDAFAGYESNEQAILRTAAHELTHVIQDWSPAEYANLRDHLIDSYYSHDENTVAELIQHQMDVARQSGRMISESEAMDELVADACEMMLGDADVAANMAKTNPTLFERIKNWISDFVDAIRKAMEGVDANSREARLLTGMQERFEKARDLWYAGFEQAAENRGGGLDAEIAADLTADTENLTAEAVQNVEAAAVQPVSATPQQAQNAPRRAIITKREVNANRGTAFTNDQTPVNFHYEVVPADSLITSNNQRFEANPDYPQELQPRDRTRTASREQVYTIASNLNPARLGESADVQNGAPIVGSDLVVESGNGRTMALRYALQNIPAKAQQYTNWLRQNAERFGIDPSTVQDGSILVRVRDTAMDRTAFVKAANESTTAAYSESEAAESDAEKLTPAMMQIFEPGENGEMNTADNASFANQYMERVIPAAERGNYMQADGTISQRGWERIQNGIFQRAYGSAALTQLLSESTDEGSRNILKAMLRAAPRAVQIAEQVRQGNVWDIDLGGMLTEAAKRYLQIKRDGIKLDTYLNQTTMPGLETESAGAQALMRVFEDLSRAPRRLGNVLQNVMNLLEEYGDPRQVSMLGESTAPDAAALISQAVARESQDNAAGVRYSVRDQAMDDRYMQAVIDGDEFEMQEIVNEAAKNAGYRYVRYTRNKLNPANSTKVDYYLFVADDRNGEVEGVYGDNKYFATDKTAVDITELQDDLRTMWRQFAEEEGYPETVWELTDDDFPDDIVNSAGIFDNREFMGYLFENDFFDRFGDKTPVIKTNDGLVVFGNDNTVIKAGEPITRDDQGNVIPLSERFNSGNNDIRYSLRYNAGNGLEMGMTDSDRYEKLKGTKIELADATNALSVEELQPFKTSSYKVARRPMAELARRYSLISGDGNTAKVLTNKYLTDIPATFSKASLDESIEQQKTGIVNMAALMPVFEETYKNAVPVLLQGNRYLYTAQAESRTEGFMYLLGGFSYNGKVIPVQFELKQNNNPDDNSIYVVATIKKDAIMVLETANAAPKAPAPSNISIEDLIGYVKGDETKILSNLPSQFLSDYQKEGKRKGLEDKGRHTRDKAARVGRDVNAPANMTTKRIDDDIKYYGGSGDYSKAYMTYISPDEYLSLTTSNQERIENESRVMVAAEMRENDQTPFLRFDQETGEITGHEGRHRMMAMKNAGVKQVAILMIPDGEAGRYNRKIVDSLDVTGQNFGSTRAWGSTTLNNLIPVNQKHRQELIDTYGESRNWFQYSDRDTSYRTNRQILADALTSIAANENERRMLEDYQNVAGRLDMNERRISQINEELRNLRLEEPSSDREQALLAERKQLEQEITAADRRLYTMERMAPLKRIASQERARAENDLQRAREHMQRYRQGIVQRERIGSIQRTSRRLAKWLTAPAGKSGNYVPEALRAPLGEFLLTIDKMSAQRRAGGPMTQEDKKFAYQLGQISRMLQSIDDGQTGTTEEQISGMYLDMPKQFTQNLADLVSRVEQRMQSATREGGNMLDQMTNEELETLDQSLIAISSSISHINDFMTDSFTKGVRETAGETIKELDAMKPQRKQGAVRKFLTDFITWDNSMPIFAFDRLGTGGKQIFAALREGQSKLAFNAKQIIDLSEKAYTAKEAQQWNKEIKEFDFGKGNVIRIPVSNLMSLYCLNKREQGIGHLYGEGIRVADFTEKGKTVTDRGHVISEAQVQKMLEALTPRQRQVAEELQHIMSTTGAEMGNHVSMRRFGFRQFTEKNYFPIKSDSDLLPARTDNGTGNELYKLLNMSAAKPLVQKANNRLMLENIFDVYATHMSDMAQYNALALPVLDAVKWLNFKESTMEEGGTAKYTSGVRDSIRNAYGQSAIKYVTEFLKDINGGGMTGDTSTKFYQKMLGKYNRVAVAANLRVALLQPLAIIRAGVELPGTSLASGTIKAIPNLRKEVAEMQAHSGIALWKDLGYREMNIGRSVKDQIQHTETWQDKVSDKSMALAGIMDNVTWAAIWKASKEYINRTQPGLTRGSDAYFKAVTQKFEDVVYKTQVVDSMLTKSQLMRSQDFGHKLMGSFMSEPTTTFNQLMAVWDKFRLAMKKGATFSQAFQQNGKMLGRTAFYYLLAAAVNTAIEQLMTAYRDDDDYENFQEKYVDGFWATMIDNANPLTMLPGMKQVWEAGGKRLLGMDTFDDQNVLTEGINTVVDGIEKIAQGKGTVWGRAYTLAKGLSMTSGLPIHPMMREFQALWNATAAQIQPDWRLETSPTSKTIGYDILYKALKEKDEERFEYVKQRLLANGSDDEKIATNMANRIKADFADGQISTAEAESRLVEMTGEKENDAYFKVQKWQKNEDNEDYNKYDNLKSAVLSGAGVEAARKELTDHGMTDKQVTAKINSLMTEAAKNGEITDAQASAAMVKYGGVSKDDAYWRLQSAHYEKTDDDDSFQKYGKLEEAVVSGKGVEAAKKELTSHGVEEKDVTSKVRSIVTEQVVNHGMSDAKAMDLLQKYGEMDENEAWIRTQELTYQKKTGESTSSDTAMVIYAVDNNQNPQAAIDSLLAHKKTKSSIASSITSHYKEEYLQLLQTDKTKAAALKGRLVSIFDYLGYKGLNKVNEWENPKKKKTE